MLACSHLPPCQPQGLASITMTFVSIISVSAGSAWPAYLRWGRPPNKSERISMTISAQCSVAIQTNHDCSPLPRTRMFAI